MYSQSIGRLTVTAPAADADIAICKLMRTVLEFIGYSLLETVDGDDAVRLFFEYPTMWHPRRRLGFPTRICIASGIADKSAGDPR